MANVFDVARVRDEFPALNRIYKGQHVVYFDGPGGSQVVQQAIDAMTNYMVQGGANLHGVFPSSIETEALISDARFSAAALLGTRASEIAFGPNMTTLNLAISRALSKTWAPGTEIVVSELDHRANVDPWLLAAKDRGVTVKWLTVNTDTLTLELEQLDSIITEKTNLVAVGLSSNAVGTVTDVAKVSKRAHDVGALVAVDAVHAVPHIAVDRDALGADILLCSAYKFFGPHVGIAAIHEDVFKQLDVYKLLPAPSYVPDKLETGTQNHEGLAGVIGAISFMASLGRYGAALREKITHAMALVEEHEDNLANKMRTSLAAMKGIRVYAAPQGYRKTPTVAFTLDGLTPREVCEQLVEDYGIFVADGDFYATTLADKLGVSTSGGFVRAGLAPYNTEYEVDAFIEAMNRMTSSQS